MTYGEYVRQVREERRKEDRSFSLRQVAIRIGIEPAYLSKIERGETPPPSESATRKLAAELDLDVDVLLAMSGKVSSDLREIILNRPALFAELIRQLRTMPDDAIVRLFARHNLRVQQHAVHVHAAARIEAHPQGRDDVLCFRCEQIDCKAVGHKEGFQLFFDIGVSGPARRLDRERVASKM